MRVGAKLKQIQVIYLGIVSWTGSRRVEGLEKIPEAIQNEHIFKTIDLAMTEAV